MIVVVSPSRGELPRRSQALERFDGKTTERSFAASDQFAPELIEFASCIQEDREPEPNGHEGWADIRIIEALYRSAIERRPIQITNVHRRDRPSLKQLIKKPPIKEPKLVKAASPTGGD